MRLTLILLLIPLGVAADSGHEAFDALLTGHVASGKVDYAGIAAKGAALDAYIAGLGTASLTGRARAEQMAFWINAYNALTLDVVSDNLPLSSIKDLDGGKVWDTRRWTVAGLSVTLNDIEHKILRTMGDPRIHAAINCASKGCPPLRAGAFTAEGLDAQLDAAVRAWALGNGVAVSTDRVGLNSIFDWFGDDFTGAYGPAKFDIPGVEGKPEAALNFLMPHLAAETRQQLQAGGYVTYWSPYDWALNKK